MNTAQPIDSLTLDALQHLIQHPDPAVWGPMNPQTLRKLQDRFRQHWSAHLMALHPLRLFAWVVAVMVVITAIKTLTVGPAVADLTSGQIVFMLVVSALKSVVVTVVVAIGLAIFLSLAKVERFSAASDRLRVVHNPEFYSKFSLSTLAQSPSAQAYYDEVRQQGRDFCVVDFDLLLKLTAADRLNDAHPGATIA